jgi:hypothetical protein
MWFTRVRVPDAGLLLAAVAALVWLAVLALGMWLIPYPALTASDAVGWVLLLAVLPFGAGAAVGWKRYPTAHLVGMSILAVVLAEWVLFLGGMLIATVTNFEQQITFLSNTMNRLELLVGFALFSVSGAVMGAAGGAVAAVILRRRARAASGATPLPNGAGP